MKKIIAVILSLSTFCAIAQVQSPTDFQASLDKIAADEQAHHAQLGTFAPSGAGGSFDVKYHRFEWRVDPSVRFIKGSVTGQQGAAAAQAK